MDPDSVEGVIGAAEGAVTADAAAAELRAAKRAHPIEGPCANCGTALVGRHCHVCGQVSDDLKRPIWALLHDALEGLFSVDGRFIRTVPPLLLRPGLVSKVYLAGARARFVQPFRLFLFASVLFLLAVSLTTGGWSGLNFDEEEEEGVVDLTDVDRASESMDHLVAEFEAEGLEAPEALSRAQAAIAETRERAAAAEDSVLNDPRVAELRRAEKRREMKCDVRRSVLPEELGLCPAEDPSSAGEDGVREVSRSSDGENGELTVDSDLEGLPIGMRRHIVHNAERIIDNPDLYFDSVNRWTSRMLIALFPIFAALMGITHFWKRRFYYYDHLVVSLHFHAFIFFLIAIAIGASVIAPTSLIWLIWVGVVVWSNYYLYKVHRLVYGCGRFSSVVRTILVDWLYFFILTFALVALLLAGFLAV